MHSHISISRYRDETSQVLSSTTRDRSWRGLTDSTVPPEGSQIKGLITQKTVNSTCIRTVFKIKKLKLHRNVDDTLGTGRGEG